MLFTCRAPSLALLCILMTVCICYFSKFGNGKECANLLAQLLTERGVRAIACSIAETSAAGLPAADFYVFSTPTQAGTLPGKMRRYLKKMHVPRLDSAYALMTTCLGDATSAMDRMSAILERRGMRSAIEGIRIRVKDLKGPIAEGHEEALAVFAGRIATSSSD